MRFDLEDSILNLYRDLKLRKVKIDSKSFLDSAKGLFKSFYTWVIEEKNTPSQEALRAALMICLDVYTYSETGDVLISDHQYDQLHSLYIKHGGKQLIYPDFLQSKWNMDFHKKSYMVGSLRKVYTKKDLSNYIDDLCMELGQKVSDMSWIVAPKYDGISACLEFRDKELVQALTRGDSEDGGRRGQDITPMARNLMNIQELGKRVNTGFLKVELLCPSSSFERIKDEFRNRRSATSAIVNAPKNIDYAPLIYAMPLLIDKDGVGHPQYIAENAIRLVYPRSESEILQAVDDMMEYIRSPEFAFRVDGVVLYPIIDHMKDGDAMGYSMAYKINTAENAARIEYGYVSIGRTGKATPMIRVEPTEVNETIVTDVSLGSFPIFHRMNLMEGEIVTIYSAGDVIPQMKLRHPRVYPKNAKPLFIPEVCPYCHQNLVDYACVNPACPRQVTGAITNFLEKLGAEDISDGTIESLRSVGVVKSIPDLFRVKQSDIERIDGFGVTSAAKIMREIESIKTKEIPYATFFGALGIPGAAKTTWEKIFDFISPSKFLQYLESYMNLPYKHRASNSALYFKLMDIPSKKKKKAEAILRFFDVYYDTVKDIMRHMNLVRGQEYIGEIVFTGFRDTALAEKFASMGFRTADSVKRDTVAVIAADLSSGKAKKARKYEIPLFAKANIERAFAYCEEIVNQLKGEENYV